MANVKISSLPSGGALTGSEEIPMVQSATTKKTTAQDIANLAPAPTVPTGANPTATAGPTAVNGAAATFMRSDAAPAIQQASAAQKGIVQVDGTTITAAAGIISVPQAATGQKGVGQPDNKTIRTTAAVYSIIGNALGHPGFISGAYYSSPGCWPTLSGQALAANTLYFCPFFVPYSVTFSEIGCNVTTLAAASHCELGIYSNNNGNPDALLYDAGQIDSSGTGGKAITGLSLALDPGWCWLAVASDGTPSLTNAASNGFAPFLLGWSNAAGSILNFGRQQAWVYSTGNLPANASGLSSLTSLRTYFLTLRL